MEAIYKHPVSSTLVPCNEERKEGSGSRRPGSIWGLSYWKTLVLEFRKGFDADYAKGFTLRIGSTFIRYFIHGIRIGLR